jgi:hypothetical protein
VVANAAERRFEMFIRPRIHGSRIGWHLGRSERLQWQSVVFAIPTPATAALVDAPTEAPEVTRGALELADHDEMASVPAALEFRFGEARAIGLGFQILAVKSIPTPPCSTIGCAGVD